MGKVVAVVAIAAAIAVNFIPGFQGWASALIINAGLGAGLSVGAGIAISGALVTGITAIGLASAASFFAPGPPSIKGSSGGVAVNYRQPIVNAPIVYGRTMVGGPIVFYHAVQGDTEYRYFVVTLAGHEIEAIDDIYLNDVLVTLDGSQMVTNGDFADNCWIWPQTGTATDAPPSAFTSQTGGRWTSAHQGKGIAKLYLKFELTDDIISGGMPKMTAVVRGKKVYDPRTLTTVYSNNAALCFWDYMLTTRTDGGYGLEDTEVDWDHVAAEANICDEPVTLLATGTEARYACDGVVDTGAGPDTIRESLLLSMAGDYAEVGPLVNAYAGAWRAVTATLSEGDVVSDINYRPIGTSSKYVNEVRGVFLSEADKWQPIEFPAQTYNDGEEPQTLDLELAFVKSPTQAQRIAKIILNRARAEKSLTWPMTIAGLNIAPLDNVSISTDLYSFLGNYSFQVRSWSISDQWGVNLTLIEESADYYDWTTTDEQAISRPAIDLVTVNAGMIGAGAGVSGLTTTDGAATQINVAFTMPATLGLIGYAIYRATSSTSFASAAWLASGNATTSEAVTYLDTGLTTGISYSYWVIVYSYFGSSTSPIGPSTRAAP